MRKTGKKDMQKHRYAVILAGGSGKRLWPLSRNAKPKQFQSILGEQSLLKKMHELLKRSFDERHIFIQVPENFLPFVKEQFPGLSQRQILIEPSARDTGPAFAFAALAIQAQDPDALIGFYFSDHLVQTEKAFDRAVERSFAAVENYPDHLALVGVKPLYPHTGLGYIEMGETLKDVQANVVRSFTEKPDEKKAARYVSSGRYLWNTGYYAGSARHILALLQSVNGAYRAHIPVLQKALRERNRKKLAAEFAKLPKLSFEYTVTEKATGLLTVSSDMLWSDVGDWGAIDTALLEKSGASVRTVGSAIAHDSKNSLLVSNHRTVLAVGVRDVVVVETEDAVLVMSKKHARKMKQALEKLRAKHPEAL